MATVPMLQPQVTEQALPNARHDTVATPALLNAGAVEMGTLGKGLESAGAGLTQIAFEMEKRENADVLFATEAADKGAWISYEADMRANRQGHGAKGAANDTAAWWKSRISKNLEGMTEAQQRNYIKRITNVQMQAIENVSKFEGHQIEIAHDTSWAADKTNTINLAAATPTPGVVATQTAEIKKMNAYQAARKGWDAKVLQAENGKDITNLHAQAIQTLVQQNPALAEAYYKEHELEIDGSKRAEIGEFARKATSANVGASAADLQWKLHGPKSDTDAADIDMMARNIREQFKNDQYTRDAALTQLKQMDAERDKGIRARDQKRTATVNELLMSGRSLAAVKQTPAWAALDGTEQRKILEHEERIIASRTAQAAASESRAYTRDARAQMALNTAGLETTMRLSNPDTLVAMTRDQVINLRTTIGDQNTNVLLQKWDAFTKNGTLLSEARLDNDQFNTFAVKAGLDPNSKSDSDKKLIIETRDRVERIIGAEQNAKKRPLSREERDKILQQQIDNSVMQYRMLRSDKSVPLVALPVDKQADAYVVVGGEKVKLSSIPADYRAELTAARKARGLATPEKTLAEMWLKRKKAPAPKSDVPQ